MGLDIRQFTWVDVLLVGVFLVGLLGALGLRLRQRRVRRWSTKTKRSPRPTDPVELANAELEGRRLLQEGWQAFREGRVDQAERVLKAALRCFEELGPNPLIGEARYRLALLYVDRGESERGIRVLRPLLARREFVRAPQPLFLLADLYEGAGRLEEAERALLQARRWFKHRHREVGVDVRRRRLRLEAIRQELDAVVSLAEAEDGTQRAERKGGSEPLTRHIDELSQQLGVDVSVAHALLELGFDLNRLPRLAEAQPAKLADLLQVSETEARRLIEAARSAAHKARGTVQQFEVKEQRGETGGGAGA